MPILKKIFGDPNQKAINKIKPLVEKVNELEKSIEKLSDADLRKKTSEFKEKIEKKLKNVKGEEQRKKTLTDSLDEITPEAFAVVREASKRALGLRHFEDRKSVV